MKLDQEETKELEAEEAPEIVEPEEGEETEEKGESTYIEEEIKTPNNKKPKSQSSVKYRILGESPKALKFSFEGGKELWVPKSGIYSKYDSSNIEKTQKLLIDMWILKKKI